MCQTRLGSWLRFKSQSSRPLLLFLKVSTSLNSNALAHIYHSEFLGDMIELCYGRRGENLDHRYLDTGSTSSSSRVMLTCTIPLSEIVTDFFDQLKGRSSGFASFE